MEYYSDMAMEYFGDKLCRYILYGPTMMEMLQRGNSGVMFNRVIMPPKNNQMWGNEFILMDSNSFTGGIGADEYENIVNMFMNIWDVWK